MRNKASVAIPLVLAMLVSACGGGGDGPGADPGGTTAPAPSPASAPAPAPAPGPSASTIAATLSTSRAIAVLANGDRVAAWSDAGGTIRTQRFDATGKLVGSTVALANGTVNGIAALPAGGYVVEFSTDAAVLVQVISAAGALVGPASVVRTQAQVEADLAGSHDPKLLGGAGVFALGGGGFAAAYATFHNAVIPGDTPTDLRAQKFDPAGSATGSPVFLASSRNTSTLAIAPTASGGVAVAAMYICPCAISGSTSGDLFDASLQDMQTPFGDHGGLYGDMEMRQSVAALANGNVFVKWTVSTAGASSGSHVDQVKGQVFGSQGATGVLVFPNAGPDAQATALAGGGFLLAWGTSAQAFDASGQPSTGVMQIPSGSVAATPDGGFVVLAQVGDQLVAQQFAVGS